jgi:Photosynthetic reaction centre cytochrome C subunit
MNHLRIISVLLLMIAGVVVLNSRELIRPAATQANEKTAEQVYKNIQMFKGMPASQLLGAMNFMAGSLGVSCNHCHVPNQFAKDDKPAKQTARQHLQMTRAMNDANFGGKTVINCVSCHRGEARPFAALKIAPISSLENVKAPASPQPLPTVDQILARHVSAVGGSKKLESLITLKLTGTREMRNGGDAPSIEQLEIYRKAPNKLLMSSGAAANSSAQAFNGTIGWRSFNGRVTNIGGPDLLGARRDADFFKDFRIREHYAGLKVIGLDTVDGRDAFVIEARFPEAHPARMFGIESEKLYFDAQSGFLIRRYMEYPTPLGLLPEATDYISYRKVNGLMFPFVIRLSRPPLVVSQKFNSIKVNSPVDDVVFEKPVTK